MLGQGCDGTECLSTLITLDLEPTVGVHTLVAAQVRELGVSLETDFASERLNTRVNVCVLFEARTGGEGFAAVGTGVRSGADVLRPDVSLEVRRIGEDLLAVLAGVTTTVVVRDLMSD